MPVGSPRDVYFTSRNAITPGAAGSAEGSTARPSTSRSSIVTALVIFFAGFNVLEAKLPALVSRAAPRGARGAATGLYSSVQFLGTFVGGAAGGALAQHAGFGAVLGACLAITVAWLAAAWNMAEFQASTPATRS